MRHPGGPGGAFLMHFLRKIKRIPIFACYHSSSKREGEREMSRWRKRMLTVLFLCYAAVLVWAILCKLQPPSEILAEQMDKPVLNLYPFRLDRSSPDLIRNQLREIRANILLFVPMGLYLSLLWGPGRGRRTLLTALAVSYSLEAAQYILRIGNADVTDLITNTAGALLGLGLYALFTKLLGKRTEGILTGVALVCTVAILTLMAVMILMN